MAPIVAWSAQGRGSVTNNPGRRNAEGNKSLLTGVEGLEERVGLSLLRSVRLFAAATADRHSPGNGHDHDHDQAVAALTDVPQQSSHLCKRIL